MSKSGGSGDKEAGKDDNENTPGRSTSGSGKVASGGGGGGDPDESDNDDDDIPRRPNFDAGFNRAKAGRKTKKKSDETDSDNENYQRADRPDEADSKREVNGKYGKVYDHGEGQVNRAAGQARHAPPSYTGHKSVDAHEYLEDFHHTALFNGWTNHQCLQAFTIAMKQGTPAKTWYRRLTMQEKSDWLLTQTKFLERFGGRSINRDEKARLHEIKQDQSENLMCYSERLMVAAARVADAPGDAELIKLLIANSQPRWQLKLGEYYESKKVMGVEPNLDELINYAQTLSDMASNAAESDVGGARTRSMSNARYESQPIRSFKPSEEQGYLRDGRSRYPRHVGVIHADQPADWPYDEEVFDFDELGEIEGDFIGAVDGADTKTFTSIRDQNRAWQDKLRNCEQEVNVTHKENQGLRKRLTEFERPARPNWERRPAPGPREANKEWAPASRSEPPAANRTGEGGRPDWRGQIPALRYGPRAGPNNIEALPGGLKRNRAEILANEKARTTQCGYCDRPGHSAAICFALADQIRAAAKGVNMANEVKRAVFSTRR